MKQKFNPVSGQFDFVDTGETTKDLFFDASVITPMAVISPIAAAASYVALSSVTGLMGILFAGNADTNASLNFVIPPDYVSGGKFKLLWSTPTTSLVNSINISPIISIKSLGDDIRTITETLTPQTFIAGTEYLLQETDWFTPSTIMSPNQYIILRITRPAITVAADNHVVGMYFHGVVFTYNT